eukprot:Tamp_37712.p1 GENE.Tamp_37712~~Tamp_37712.p1  ORF type:complete len:156 (+),score=40.24 Tamp_37712:26-469(+)
MGMEQSRELHAMHRERLAAAEAKWGAEATRLADALAQAEADHTARFEAERQRFEEEQSARAQELKKAWDEIRELKQQLMDADRALRLEKSEHRETKLKLLKSAPTSVTPNVERSSLEWARQEGHVEIVKLLQARDDDAPASPSAHAT